MELHALRKGNILKQEAAISVSNKQLCAYRSIKSPNDSSPWATRRTFFWRNRCVCDRVLSLKSVARIQTNSNFCATGHNDKPLSLRQIFSREFSKLHWENYRCDKAGRNFPVIGSLMRFGLKFSLISRKYFTQGKLSEVRGICAK